MGEQNNGGEIVRGWKPPVRPDAVALRGRHVRLDRLVADRHAADLYRAYSKDETGSLWNYMPYGPFSSVAGYHHWIRDWASTADPCFFTLTDVRTGRAGGVMSLLRITPEMGSIEVGHIAIAPEMQRTVAATEAIYLLMDWVFEVGYRRFEWKCDAANMRSRRSAERFGFSFEGIFRQHIISKGRNRDTAWFAATDKDWPGLAEAYQAWLGPENFDAEGRQNESLADLTQLVRVADDPRGG